ncbi:BlaI/MecI/CopY family transcriptional regulator [Oceanobacter sp. 3_MG-2023]|uniref:BlaI/MecI/CopY family transcriptional regulator n=2 Tax=Oceanobacter TaxID=196079 RepID=UPI00273278F1|nr:BlaI/MecI/CopY family transcriptional regulator [Oceanobacter sp. 3_MG-2023]MDP2505194.1 BlaI/MecI/CopY family transcriptional regulator [Oceanobacter sp. 3_MG-2023]
MENTQSFMTVSLKRWLGFHRCHSRTPTLGEREILVMELLWQQSPQSAQSLQVQQENISLSTVQSTLERLHRKHLLAREKSGRSYLYRPLLQKADLVACLLSDIATDLGDANGQALVAGFVDYLSATTPEAQGQLRQALEQDTPSAANPSNDQ